jgi:hypothetical protein
MTRSRIELAAALAALALACGGGGAESDFRWEEEVVEGPEQAPPSPRPTEAPRERDERELEPRGSAPSERARRGGAERGEAIYSPRERAFCDERVATCYTGQGGHVGLTEEEFGVEAGRRLERRLDAGPDSPRGIAHQGAGICDRLAEICYAREGPDVELTRREFGGAAAADLAARQRARRSGPAGRGEAIYAPRRGVACDELVAACYVEEEVHLGHTREQFGREAAVALQRRVDRGRSARDGVYRPAGGAVCDRLSKVCYDRFGASASLTHAEFGRPAAVRAAERVE